MSDNDEDFAFLFGGPAPKAAGAKKKLKKPTTTTTEPDHPAPKSKKTTSTTTQPKASEPIASRTTNNSPNNDDNDEEGGTIDLFTTTQTKKQRKLTDTITTDAETTTPLLAPPSSKTTKLILESNQKSIQKSFSQLGISSWLISTLSKLKISLPTDIQLKGIPSIIKGDNVIARAKTGSGKTAAFALPILENLSHDPYGIYALVMTPTRELALQIKDQFDVFGSPIGLTTVCVIGGVDMVKQAQALEGRPHVVIATPGRLSDLLVRGSISNFGAKHLKYLVLDEADRLFEDCFTPFIDTILDHIPSITERQTILVSATLTNELITSLEGHALYDRLIAKKMVYHQSAQDDDNLVETLTQSYLFFPLAVKECYISYLLQFANPKALLKNDAADVDHDHKSIMKKRHHNGRTKDSGATTNTGPAAHGATTTPQSKEHPTGHHQSCIVFCKTVKTAEFLSMFLLQMGVRNVPLHSKVKQAQRIANLNRFRSGDAPVLIATDIAARGLDIPQVTLVVNYDLPHSHQDYIHRVGRTARANRHGIALTLVTQYDINKLQELEEGVGVKLTEFAGVDEGVVIQNVKTVNEKKKLVQIRIEEMDEAEAR